jgi:hypothetical protein
VARRAIGSNSLFSPSVARGEQVILLFPDIMRNSVIGGFDSQHDVSPVDLNLSLRAGYGRRPFPMALPKSVATLKWCQIVKISDSILADPTEKAVFGQGKSPFILAGSHNPLQQS